MEEIKIQSLRKLAVKLDAGGAASVYKDTMLYEGGHGFVGLQLYVPVTPNARGAPFCTVHQSIIDNTGKQRQLGDPFNLRYIGRVDFGGFEYMLFENPMPDLFMQHAGELCLVFNYVETADNVPLYRLTSGVCRFIVHPGGKGGEPELGLDGQEAALINANAIALEQLEGRVDNLFQPIDNLEANMVGKAEAQITPDGRLKFVRLKGEPGKDGTNIENIAKVRTESNGDNVYRITLTDGTEYEFVAPKGNKGVEIIDVKFIEATANGDYIYEIKMSDGRIFPFITPKGETGNAAEPENFVEMRFREQLPNGDFIYEIITTEGKVFEWISPRGYVGGKGDAGNSITNIEQVSVDDFGNYIYRIFLSDGASYDFIAPKGDTGKDGIVTNVNEGFVGFIFDDETNMLYVATMSAPPSFQVEYDESDPNYTTTTIKMIV